MNYIDELRAKLEYQKTNLARKQEKILQTPTSSPEFDRLIRERNALTVDIQTTQDRIYYHNKPGNIIDVQILTQS